MSAEPILVVEDDVDLRRLLELVCRLQGIDAVMAPDAPSALSVLDDESVALVLTDLNLGGDHDGLEVVRAGVAHGHPVVVMSASVDVEESLLMRLGASLVIPKPFDVLSLPVVIDEVRRA